MEKMTTEQEEEDKPWYAHKEKSNEDTLADAENKRIAMEIEAELEPETKWLNSILTQFETDNGDRIHNKVVFMSSGNRKYFPEDPGTSRFGVAFSMMKAPGDVPNPSYFPPPNRLEKPAIISTKGYGIGGLLGLRFPKDIFEDNPAPNAYNVVPEVPPPPRKKTFVDTELLLLKTLTMDTVQVDPDPDEEERKLSESEIQSYLTHGQINPVSQTKLSKEERARLRNLCMQTFIGFGSNLSITRFGKEPKWHNVGVGYYDLRKKSGEIRKAHSFGRKPVRLIPPALTRCNYKGPDKCFECSEVLRTTDYYRTLSQIKNPFYQVKPADRVKDEDFGFHIDPLLDEGIHSGSDSLMERKYVFVSLCRACYCHGMSGKSPFWDPSEMPKMFAKTRHCFYMHDHERLPIFTQKADCKLIKKLSRKEILVSKYYKDACERVIKTND